MIDSKQQMFMCICDLCALETITRFEPTKHEAMSQCFVVILGHRLGP